MNYNEQLKTQNWKEKREQIILRDKSSCAACNIKRNELLGLSNKFGICDYEQSKSRGYFFARIENNSNNIFFYQKRIYEFMPFYWR